MSEEELDGPVCFACLRPIAAGDLYCAVGYSIERLAWSWTDGDTVLMDPEDLDGEPGLPVLYVGCSEHVITREALLTALHKLVAGE